MVSCLMLCALSLPLQAQTWGEWFRQKKTQRRYLAEQVLALKVYGGYLKKGYELASGGLQTIRELAAGELDLHRIFLGSLSKVSPLVKRYGRLGEVLAMQAEISVSLARIQGLEHLNVSDRAFLAQVRDNVLRECSDELDGLADALGAGKLELSEAARMQRLAAIYRSTAEKREFVADFLGQLQVLVAQRKAESRDLEWERRNYGLRD